MYEIDILENFEYNHSLILHTFYNNILYFTSFKAANDSNYIHGYDIELKLWTYIRQIDFIGGLYEDEKNPPYFLWRATALVVTGEEILIADIGRNVIYQLNHINDKVNVTKVAPDGIEENHGEHDINSFAYDGTGFWMSSTGNDCTRCFTNDGIFYHFDKFSGKQDKVVEQDATFAANLFYFDNRLFAIERPFLEIATRIFEIDLAKSKNTNYAPVPIKIEMILFSIIVVKVIKKKS